MQDRPAGRPFARPMSGAMQDAPLCSCHEQRRGRAYASKRRKIVTAFWPPNPKPFTATVSTFAGRATFGT